MITLAEIPASYMGVAGGTGGGLVIMFFFASKMLKSFQEARTTIVKEVRMELAAASQPQSVAVKEPLTVKAELRFPSLEDHEELELSLKEFAKTVDERFEKMALGSAQSREKIYVLLREQSSQLKHEMKQDIGGVHERITILMTSIARIEGKLEAQSK